MRKTPNLFLGKLLTLSLLFTFSFLLVNTVSSQDIKIYEKDVNGNFVEKNDFLPGETAYIVGTGWTQDALVDVHIEEEPTHEHVHDFHNTVVTNDTWTITYPILERHFGVKFLVTAEGLTSGVEVTATFTDGLNFGATTQIKCAGEVATFSANATGSGGTPITFIWQVSTDGGTIYNTISNNAIYSGATTTTLLINTNISLNGNKYRIIGTTSGGSNQTAGPGTLTVNPAPTIYNVNFNVAALCGGDFQVTLSGSELGVSYTLYSQNNPNIETLIGTGNPLQFTSWTTDPNDSKTYHIIANDPSKPTCANFEMNGEAKVTQANAPDPFNVTGGGSICGAGPFNYPIGIDGSETNVSYQVWYYDGVNPAIAVGSPAAGTGAAIPNIFTASLEGTYTVIGTNTTGNACATQMTGSASISVDVIAPVIGTPAS
ncbi:MAG: hypothetical protein V4683_19980, partial [Bacteroidota bacterium]